MGVCIEQIRKFAEENPEDISRKALAELEMKAADNEEGYVPINAIVQAVGYPTAMQIEFYPR